VFCSYSELTFPSDFSERENYEMDVTLARSKNLCEKVFISKYMLKSRSIYL
jgi:hypothetical protein